MTRKANKAVSVALAGHSMVYYSSWMDHIRSLPEYAETVTWHYANVDEQHTYRTMPKAETGDVVTAVELVMEKLMNRDQLNDSLETLYVKFLVHLVGDMHCPMHAGRRSDLGGNRFSIRWFGNPTNLHSLWDSTLIEFVRKWSYTEWRENLDVLDPQEILSLTRGSIREWFEETVEAAQIVYQNVEEDQNCGYDYMFEHFPILELQLRRAGYRLAALLNRIYR
ncbi:MAG: S1/P1 nuclease [Rikenellaceae bacterium]|nr:S1/P1 nuclease [Rikenellaceae bacterium]